MTTKPVLSKISPLSNVASGMVRLMMLGVTTAALMALPSCKQLSDVPLTGSVTYRDKDSGAKAVLILSNRKAGSKDAL